MWKITPLEALKEAIYPKIGRIYEVMRIYLANRGNLGGELSCKIQSAKA
jgi:hypothetical protein